MTPSGNIVDGGAVPGGLPTAVTGTLSGATLTLTVDFTTYSAYDIIINNMETGSNSQTGTIKLSSDGGSTYVAETISQLKFLPTASFQTASDFTMLNNNDLHNIIGTISQPSTSGISTVSFTGGDNSATVSYMTNTTHATSAAVNMVKITGSAAFTSGSVILQPKSKR